MRDTSLPIFTQPPQNIVTAIKPPGTQSYKVDIGHVVAVDRECSGEEAIVTNDAPDDMIFPPGLSTVTWQADDGRGNIAIALQKVEVRVILYFAVVLSSLALVAIVALSVLVGNQLKKKKLP